MSFSTMMAVPFDQHASLLLEGRGLRHADLFLHVGACLLVENNQGGCHGISSIACPLEPKVVISLHLLCLRIDALHVLTSLSNR